jgi:signal transduction histidine kinase
MLDQVTSHRARDLARLALLAAAYLVLAKLGLRVATVGRSVTLVWPPTGLALAALLLGSRRLWPAIAVGAFLVNATTPGVGVLTAAGIALGNTLEAYVGATLVRRRPFRTQLDETRGVLRFALFGAVVATLLAATIGTLSLFAQGLVEARALLPTFRVWWAGDAMGALVVAPALMCWGSRAVDVERRSVGEAVALGVTLAAASLGMLTEPHATHPYLVFPPLIWAALRFGPRGATAATLAVSVWTIASTLTGRGAFAVSSMGDDLMGLEAFLAAVALTSLVLGATTAERVQAIRAREHFISIASHELRAPLAPIRLQVQRILRGLARNPQAMTPESIIESIQVVERQSARLSRLLENVLDTTRLKLGRLPLHPEDVDAVTVFDEVAATMREMLATAGCTLTVDKRGTPAGHWDRARLGQVLTNLLSNACKHGGSGLIEVSLDGGSTRTKIVVRDHGPGVAPEERERIFDRFEHAETGGPDSGLGLGLYVAREIVQAHGGRLTVDNPPGGGAAFEVDLPARPPGGARVPRSAPPLASTDRNAPAAPSFPPRTS